MMMKKKSNRWLSGTKALYVLPMALVAVAAFATPRASKTLDVVIDSKVNANVLNDQNISGKNVENVAEVEEIAPALTIQDVKEVEEIPTQILPEETEMASEVYQDPDTAVFSVVEVMPEFPGGMQALMEYLAGNIKYPPIAEEMGVQGRVIVQFVVDKTGKISQARCIRGVPAPVAPANATDAEKVVYEKKGEGAYAINQEALRVVESMPAWKPGIQKGQPVNVRYTLPVTFRLQ